MRHRLTGFALTGLLAIAVTASTVRVGMAQDNPANAAARSAVRDARDSAFRTRDSGLQQRDRFRHRDHRRHVPVR